MYTSSSLSCDRKISAVLVGLSFFCLCNFMLVRSKHSSTSDWLSLIADRNNRWIGDMWIPPAGKLYTIKDMQLITKDRKYLVVGDSLSRRLSHTLAMVLQNDPNLDILNEKIDDNKLLNTGAHDHYDWDIPGGEGTGHIHWQWAPKSVDLKDLFESMDISKYTDIIIAAGIHDAEFNTKMEDIEAHSHKVFTILSNHPSVVWRTAPYKHAPKNDKHNVNVDAFNNFVRKNHPPNMRIVDSAMTLAEKSTGHEKAHMLGDTPEHFGNLGRMIQIQGIMHEWVDMRKEEDKDKLKSLIK